MLLILTQKKCRVNPKSKGSPDICRFRRGWWSTLRSTCKRPWATAVPYSGWGLSENGYPPNSININDYHHLTHCFVFVFFPGGMTSFWANLWSNQQSMLFKEEVLFVFFVIEATKVHLDISQYIPVARLDRWSRRFPKWWRCSCGFRCSTWVDQWGFAYSLPRKWSFAQHRRIAASGARDCQERAKSGLDRWHRIHRRSWRADCQRTRG